jgi:hypothetical protein
VKKSAAGGVADSALLPFERGRIVIHVTGYTSAPDAALLSGIAQLTGGVYVFMRDAYAAAGASNSAPRYTPSSESHT